MPALATSRTFTAGVSGAPVVSFYLALLALVACSGAPATRAPAPTGEIEGTITVRGVARSYVLVVPPGYDARAPMPLVFVWHGRERLVLLHQRRELEDYLTAIKLGAFDEASPIPEKDPPPPPPERHGDCDPVDDDCDWRTD